MMLAAISSEMVFDPLVPGPAVMALGLGLGLATVWLYFRLGTQISRGRSLALLGLRLLGLGMVLLLLLQPSRRETIPPPTTARVALVGLDTSRSMKQVDAGQAARLDTARKELIKAGVVAESGLPGDPKIRLLEFSDGAKSVAGSILDLAAKGPTTRLHKSVVSMLGTLAAGEEASAMILLSDGHDFELVNPVQTGTVAKNRNTPIYAVPLGKLGKARDIATRITAYQPYTYVKQKARIAAALRLIGCEYEDITVQLYRNSAIVQSKRVSAGDAQDLPVEFEVVEPETGQYEYEVRAAPLEGEQETANNSAITYLNVINQQIKVLVLEGAPYWDTTFMQRSLMRNDKFAVDALTQYGPGRVRPICKGGAENTFKVPQSAEDFAHYDVIIFGRAVNDILSAQQIAALGEYVQNRGGVVVFSRGRAFGGKSASELEPVIWGDQVRERTRLQLSREGQGASPFRALAGAGGRAEEIPELIGGHEAGEPKALTATMAYAADRQDGSLTPAMVHRRLGSGQVVSIGVEGLWRWAFNAKAEGVNTAFDRFWDQMILWLLASGDFVTARQFSFRTSAANVPLGEKIYFRLLMRNYDPSVKSVPLRIQLGDREIMRVNLLPNPTDPTRLTAEYQPERTGRYKALATFPDSTTQESRFITFSENLEETEVITDVAYLKRLCESSGGRLLLPEELGKLVAELTSAKVDMKPEIRLTSIWDRASVFYLAGLLFGADWYLRRRWGLS
jgi:hypothetical protein